MKKLKITPSKLNLYKEKISTLSDDQKSFIVGGEGAVNPGLEFTSIFDCKTKTDNCPTNSTLQPTRPETQTVVKPCHTDLVACTTL